MKSDNAATRVFTASGRTGELVRVRSRGWRIVQQPCVRQAGFSSVFCGRSECFVGTLSCLSERHKAQTSKSEVRTVWFFHHINCP